MVNKAEIGRFDGDYKRIAFNEGDKISVLLEKSGLVLGEGELLNDDDGNDISANATAVDGETYSIVGNFKQGADLEEVKDFEKEAIATAVEEMRDERSKVQSEAAKELLRDLLKQKDVINYNIRQAQKELKAIDVKLKVFK